jgi:surface protein
MKKIVFLIITLVFNSQTIKAQTVVLDANGVTVKWTGTTVPSPYFVQANPRGPMEWFAIIDNSTRVYVTGYAKNIPSAITYFTPLGSSTPIPFNNIVTTLVINMSNMFYGVNAFNQSISSWDVTNVNNMSGMFYGASAFNQPIGLWNIGSVTNMVGMFSSAHTFNQPIGFWEMSNVTDTQSMFYGASAFNQPIESWDVSNVINMRGMFSYTNTFNQPIESWDVSSVTFMDGMFNGASEFNQPIGSWNVSSVTDMGVMFGEATAFNRPIGSWDVSDVTDMQSMFYGASAFNQPIGYWDVSNVTNMTGMFRYAASFNQPNGSWDVSNVNYMDDMFYGVQLSTANYDDTLIGWATIGPNESPLKPNVTFSGGNSNYCNGETARNSIIQTYGWTITDAGLNCSSLETEIFDAISLKLYPNPVLGVLNVKVDSNLINQPYNVLDGLGRIVLNGNLNDVDTTINVDQLSKGIYYIKLSDNNASKFVKE